MEYSKIDYNDIETIPCKYGLISYPKSDLIIGKSLCEYGEWAQAELDFLLAFVNAGSTIIDVGAFIGTHTLAFAQQVGPEGNIYSFEPHLTAFEVLRLNVAQNSLSNVKVFNIALSDSAGSMLVQETYLPAMENMGKFSLCPRLMATSVKHGNVTIELSTLDAYGIDRCDLIKVDVEGMEEKVLMGSIETLRKFRPLVFAECLSLDSAWKIVLMMRDEGFDAFLHNELAYNPNNFRKNMNNFFGDARETNILFVYKERLSDFRERCRNFQNLITIATLDDLALGLLKKPQYKYEILKHTKAAQVLGLDFFANEPEVKHLNDKAKSAQHLEIKAVLKENDAQIASLERSMTDSQLRAKGNYRSKKDNYIISKKDKSIYDIVIPVYNSYQFVRKCLQSIKNYTSSKHRVILINDCSTDEELNSFLSEYSRANPEIILIENSENIGFVKSCNKGMKFSNRDIILLNSDTLVTEGWIEKLHACAYSDWRIGIVSPLFNNGTILSLPWSMANNTIELFEPQNFADILGRFSKKIYPEIPTAVGACMLIKREVIEEIGYFDEAFGMGYGEENDFCMRALKAGWKTVACDDAFIYHYGKLSFSLVEGIDERIKFNIEILKNKHPEYYGLVREFVNKNPLEYVQKTFCETLIDNGKQALMFLVHSFEINAGTELHLRALINGLKTDFNIIVFYPNMKKPNEFEYILSQEGIHCFKVPHIFSPFSTNNQVVEKIFRSVLDNFNVRSLHIQHMLFLPFNLIHIAKDRKIPVVLSLHDFFYLCNEYTLYNFKKEVCKRTFFLGNEMCYKCMAEKFNVYGSYLRERNSIVLNALIRADKIISPSKFLKERYEAELPEIKGKIEVIEHGIDLNIYKDLRRIPHERIGVGLIGNLTDKKGLRVFLESLNDLNDLDIEFHMHGKLYYDTDTLDLSKHHNLLWHGSYEPHELPEILEDLDIIVIPSIVEESYCFTLSEAFAAGVPVIAARSGALTERIQDRETGLLYESMSPRELASAIRLLVTDKKLYDKIKTNVRKLSLRSIEEMVEDYKKIYLSMLHMELDDSVVSQPYVFEIGSKGARIKIPVQIAVQVEKLLLKAREFGRKGDKLQCLESYNKIIEIHHFHHEALLKVGQHFLLSQEYKKAGEISRTFVRDYPESPEGYLYLGLSLLKLNKFEDALQVLKEALRKVVLSKEQKSIVNEYLGEAYLNLGNYSKSLSSYQSALRNNERRWNQ